MKGYASVHITQVRVGDVVFFDGKDRTVGAKDLKRDPLMGITLWGDSYNLGYLPVWRKVIARS